MSDLTAQLGSQYDLQRSADIKSKRLEVDVIDLQERNHKLQSELSANDTLRDGLRVDKERVSDLAVGYYMYLHWPHFHKISSPESAW